MSLVSNYFWIVPLWSVGACPQQNSPSQVLGFCRQTAFSSVFLRVTVPIASRACNTCCEQVRTLPSGAKWENGVLMVNRQAQPLWRDGGTPQQPSISNGSMFCSCRQIGEAMTPGQVAPGGAPALAPAKTAHQGVSTAAAPRATRSHFTCLPTWVVSLLSVGDCPQQDSPCKVL